MSSLKLRLLIAAIATVMSAHGQSIHGLYVNGTSAWLGDTTRENKVLRYANQMDFNYIIFYDLNIGWTALQKNKLAAFIKKARTNYGIVKVGASGETYDFFLNRIVGYNNSRTDASEKFDVLNYEFEFWLQSSINAYYALSYLAPNGYSSDTAGAFAWAWKEFQKIDSLCMTNALMSEIYLGWPNRGQMQQIASIADRILLHAYRTNDADVYQYTRTRLNDIASLKEPKIVMPIFSCEPAFMKNWLLTNPISKPFQTYKNNFNADTGDVKQYVDFDGYQWFVYSLMPDPEMGATITANGPTTFCDGGSVVLTASNGSSFLWSNGDTTRSITVDTTGEYSVQVLDTTGNIVMSTPTIVTATPQAIAPVVTILGADLVCYGGYTTLTTSQAGSYLWSNGDTSQTIIVTTPGDYSVSTTTAGCTSTSDAATINFISPPPTPAIIADGSLYICPGSPVTLTAPPSAGYLWSNGATTRSIVAGQGNYTVRVYSAPYCSNISTSINVVQLLAPVTPLVSVSGPTSLSTAQPTVTLTSSVANVYTWSDGQNTRSITVGMQGAYRVTVTGTNGCKAISQPVFVSMNGCTPPPVPVITAAGSLFIAPGDSVTLFSSIAGGYLWSNGLTSRSITVSTAGSFSVRTYNGGSCFSTSLPVNVKIIPARMKKEEIIHPPVSISLYPNPANDVIKTRIASTGSGKGALSIYDAMGNLVLQNDFETKTGENEITFDVANLPSGIYQTRLMIDGEHTSSKLLLAR
jgi:hypothetical protein